MDADDGYEKNEEPNSKLNGLKADINENDKQLLDQMDIDYATYDGEEEEIEFSPKITLRKSNVKQMSSKPETLKKFRQKTPRSNSTNTRSLQRQDVLPAAAETDNDGLRHSTRRRIKPLEYWRGETVKYGRSHDLGIKHLIFCVGLY